ncbi:hypothetical protein [Mycolicibacterium sp.]|uniref:hypothetical protein n=1 Tax=Mycolicibacterium sp. TaxID=2320850 RepID=UPI001A2005AE|nr:hypothetical protein [Mycolicibacterium sp.]MBJ7339583.1 hypothetical protein [Mycolicibacterium sp.]
MNTNHDTKTQRLIAAWGVAAVAAVAPALLFAGAATAHADECSNDATSCSPFPTISDSDLGSVYASPGSMGGYNAPAPQPLWPQPQPVPGASAWSSLPQENPITAVFDSLGIDRGW